MVNFLSREEDIKMDEKSLTVTVEEAARLLGIGRALAYSMAREGKLPTIKFGRRLVVPRRALEAMIEESSKAALAAGK